ncbi:hypothetical protein JB92DRAFT_3089932 [Gautieria morchelliformis]|nr:hypothetical protein JB92DRAFT_3089932 [Gautieria morchelliformis]
MSSLLSTTSNGSSMWLLPTKFLSHLRRDEVDTPPRARSFLVSLPGPWAFLTSGYALTLLAMALLLNRIQHIVVPPRHSLLRRLSRHSRSHQSTLRLLLALLIPLNLSATRSRVLLRLPSLCLLWRALARFAVILLQAADLFPAASSLAPVAAWGARPEMKHVCWSTFTAVCVALAIEALMRGLEGRGNSPSSPFNLFGYAFLLHIYSSPITHRVKSPSDAPTRPDTHVLVTIIVPLLQLTLVHTLGIRRRWVTQRLIPTAICGTLTLVHFHYVLFFSPTPYPLINYLPSLLESVLLAIIILTVSLHALTQLLLEGRITRPLLGHPRTLAPQWDEDFAVALLRVGTASLDATSAAGLGNEVVGVGAGATSDAGAEVELGRAALVAIRGGGGGGRGFAHEIKRVKALTASEGDSWIDMVWLRAWARFLGGVWALLKGSWRMLRRALWKRLRRATTGPDGPVAQGAEPRQHAEPPGSDPEEDVYQRFLRGEAVSDDEDDFSDGGSRARSRSPSMSPSDADSDEGGREAVGLYADISASPPRRALSPPLAPVLLAHVASAGAGPLTRRQYSRLLAHPRPEDEAWGAFVAERRGAAAGRAPDETEAEAEDARRNCVVCTVEARAVICWPCRCLALCDDCRANLASRFPAAKHTCPCCRRSVEGYSRIYIP